MLECTKCNTEKDESEFYRYKDKAQFRRRDGYTYWCRACYKQNYEDNRERQLSVNRKWSIKRRYGLTVEEYDALIAQGCSICGESEKRIVMDHCHATNSVRAPLCDQCNQMLGNGRDTPSLLRAGADYLELHSAV